MSDISFFSLAPVGVMLDNGNTAYIRRLAAIDDIDFRDFLYSRPNDENVTDNKFVVMAGVKLLVKCLCNQKGERLFTDQDEDVVKQMDSVTLNKLMNEALYINGIGEKAKEDIKKKSKRGKDITTS